MVLRTAKTRCARERRAHPFQRVEREKRDRQKRTARVDLGGVREKESYLSGEIGASGREVGGKHGWGGNRVLEGELRIRSNCLRGKKNRS